MLALRKANRQRFAQAAERERLRSLDSAASCRQLAAILLTPNAAMKRTRLQYALESVRRVGPAGALWLLREAEIRPRRLDARIGDLTRRERQDLAAVLARRAERADAEHRVRR